VRLLEFNAISLPHGRLMRDAKASSRDEGEGENQAVRRVASPARRVREERAGADTGSAEIAARETDPLPEDEVSMGRIRSVGSFESGRVWGMGIPSCSPATGPLGPAQRVGSPGTLAGERHPRLGSSPHALPGGIVEHRVGQDPEGQDRRLSLSHRGEADRYGSMGAWFTGGAERSRAQVDPSLGRRSRDPALDAGGVAEGCDRHLASPRDLSHDLRFREYGR
jgi:hypothetical protein